MKKITLGKDIRKSFTNSWGRFFSIFFLMAIGSFALVGLKVAGPDMRETGKNYFDRLNLADLTIISDYGIDSDDQKVINNAEGAEKVEYGYLKDVVIKDTNTSFRIFSKPDKVSKYDLVEGKMPESNDEIAIDNDYRNEYKIGDTIQFSELEDISGNKVLKRHEFKVVGYVKSSEIISSINLGQTTAGTGELKGYGVVNKEVFDSDVYMMARILYTDTVGIDPYSNEYGDLIQNHKEELEELLKDQPENRLSSIKEEYQDKIDEGQDKIQEAKEKLTDTQAQLDDAKNQIDSAKELIAENQNKLDVEVYNAQNEIDSAEKQITAAEAQMNKTLAEKLSYLQSKENEYNNAVAEFNQKKEELESAKQAINESQNDLDNKKSQLENGKNSYEQGIAELNQMIVGINQQLNNPNLTAEEKAKLEQSLVYANAKLTETNNEYSQFISGVYNPGIAQIQAGQKVIDEKKQELTNGEKQLSEAKVQLANGKKELEEGKQAYEVGAAQANNELNSKKVELETAKEQLLTQKAEGEKQLNDARNELADKEKDYQEKLLEFKDKKVDAEKEIKENEEKLSDAQKTLDDLKAPVYSIDTRRETPGAEGYKIYATVASIIDSLANIFPIFLYFVAALVTFTTMTRFVDEERVNSGTLKALGYDDYDIWKKFTIYGFVASTLGSIFGIILGHTLLPMIVYNAYQHGFILPKIELHFHWSITLVALLLSFISAVVPAYIVAVKELKEKPARLLLPKPPADGSKILLECIKPIWNKMSFTHKVTARNIFRYKKRMFMTIFGVSGSVALLFAGFGVKYSISGINERQFNDIIHYDLIVAKQDNLTDNQQNKIDELLNSDEIERQLSIYYEEMNTVAGKNNDKQIIKLIVPEGNEQFNEYIDLVNRKTEEPLALQDDGVIITERLADLLDVKKGDTITIKDSDENDREMKITDIAEMYMGHFIFMNKVTYEDIFNESYKGNANIVTLKDNSQENTENRATEFMDLSGVAGVVQNTTLINQIDTIVNSLDKIMMVLIIVAAMLAVVILYNLTNINVSERIRELSTIKVLGFFDKEVTMYIYRETISLSLIGILAGYGLGEILHSYILYAVPPDEVMFNPAIWYNCFIIPFIVVGIITIVLGIIVNRRLRNVDMLEALKSVD